MKPSVERLESAITDMLTGKVNPNVSVTLLARSIVTIFSAYLPEEEIGEITQKHER